VAANALRAFAQGTSAALVFTGHAHVWQVAALAAAGGAGIDCYYPAAQGLLAPADRASRPTAAAAMINVLGPLLAHFHLGGARSWGFIVAAYSTGAAADGMAVIRFRPVGSWWPPRCPCQRSPCCYSRSLIRSPSPSTWQ
jgi:hypothetical protein